MKDQIKILIGGKSSESGISSFQGFAMVLGGRVAWAPLPRGHGHLLRRPGQYFLDVGGRHFRGLGTFGESTLGQLFKEKFGGEYAGRPGLLYEKGHPKQAGCDCTEYALCSDCGHCPHDYGPTVQAFNIADSMHAAFGIDYIIIGAAIAILFAVSPSEGSSGSELWPAYWFPYGDRLYCPGPGDSGPQCPQIPAMFGLIFSSAFGRNAVYGGLIGSAVMWGIKRSLYASDAGTGQGAHASSATEVSHPVKQGLAESFSVYVVTIFICTATALMILSTDCYNVIQETTGTMVTEHLPRRGRGLRLCPGGNQHPDSGRRSPCLWPLRFCSLRLPL